MQSIMTRLGVLLLAACAWTAAAVAQAPASQADRAAIRAVIGDQISAFRRDDGDAAFAFAAPSIRDMFGTADRFMAMVRGGYQPVYRPRQVEFGDLMLKEGALTQVVHVVGPDGIPVTALYFMERQADGTWRISGCSLVVEPAVSA